MKQCFNINIPVEFNPSNKFEHVTERSIERFGDSIINHEFKEWLLSLGVYVHDGFYFFMPPNQEHRLHNDLRRGSNFTDCVKLNIMYDSIGTIMKWYKLKESCSPVFFKNARGETIYGYNEDDCVQIDEMVTDAPVILNGQEIHSMKNGNSNRRCYSMYVVDADTKERITWEQAQEVFKNYLVPR